MGGSALESALSAGAGEPGLKLIETLLWDGAAFPRLALHQARLAASAERLGWHLPDVWSALPDLPVQPRRVRLTVDAAGTAEVQIAPLPPSKPVWRLKLHPDRLASDDPWLGIKTTRRQTYDQARAALPEMWEEWLFANERGEVCEGTITTLFFNRGQGLRTPPLSVGCLPGVLRAELAVPEEVLRIEDLPRVRLFVGNALRGLIPAVLV